MSEQNKQGLVPRWNREEVNHCLLPVLRYVDDAREEGGTEEAECLALASLSARPEAYSQLARVWHTASPDVLDRWFGQFDCEDELLDRAFSYIEQQLDTPPAADASLSYDRQMYFAGLFHITEEGKQIDLCEPFEQYYFCDEVIRSDSRIRRVEFADRCCEYIRRYLPQFTRIRAWYRDNGEERSGVAPEYVAYMQLYDYFRDRITYEDALDQERKALEYERGGLGWFHRARKKEIAGELHDLELRELALRLENAIERYEAYEAGFAARRQAWMDELKHAPLTAFGRRKQLKNDLAELAANLEEYRRSLGIDEMQEQYRNMEKKRRS